MASVDEIRRKPHLALIEMLVAAGHEMDHLRRALESRATIGQAQGIVMERLGVDAAQSFDYLERVSSHTNSRLIEVAADIVVTRELPGISADRLAGQVRRDHRTFLF